jgi:hypothetical protein
MTDVGLVDVSPEEMEAAMPEVMDRVAQLITEGIHRLIQETAMVESAGQPIHGDLESYYRNQRMPVWTGELLNSMTEATKTADGWFFSFTAPYAEDIEEGNERQAPEDDSDAEFLTWKQGRAQGKITTRGRAHPFVDPAAKNIVEQIPLFIAQALREHFGSQGKADY